MKHRQNTQTEVDRIACRSYVFLICVVISRGQASINCLCSYELVQETLICVLAKEKEKKTLWLSVIVCCYKFYSVRGCKMYKKINNTCTPTLTHTHAPLTHKRARTRTPAHNNNNNNKKPTNLPLLFAGSKVQVQEYVDIKCTNMRRHVSATLI